MSALMSGVDMEKAVKAYAAVYGVEQFTWAVTPWYDVATHAPLRVGWYEVKQRYGRVILRWWWNGLVWKDEVGEVPIYRLPKWRGLTEDHGTYADRTKGGFFNNTAPAAVEVKDEVWTCKDGRQIEVKDLEIEHMRNILRMSLRARRKKARIEQLKLELLRLAEADDENPYVEVPSAS